MNGITEGGPRELPDGVNAPAHQPVAAIAELTSDVKAASDAASQGNRVASRQLSSIASRTDLRIAAVNELALADPERKGVAVVMIDRETARQWVNLDVTEFTRLRSAERKLNGMDAIAGHMRASPEYAEALEKRSPALAASGKTINEEIQKLAIVRDMEAAQARRHDELASQREARLAAIDASALASVARIRAEQVAEVTARLRHDPDPLLGKADIADAQRGISASRNEAFGGTIPLPAGAERSAVETEKLRIIKRPVQESELPQTIRTRFIVRAQTQRLFEAGQTDFHFRAGNRQGQLAFSDAGKQLVTPLENREIVVAMLDVAQAKHWQEITVSGSDEFRRQAWLEGRLAGMVVHGYQARDADTLLLQELQKTQGPRESANRITVAEHERTAVAQPVVNPGKRPQGTHVHVDDLSATERAGLRQAEAILAARGVSPEFSAATMAELEKRVHSERVYVGTVVDFGEARYQFNKDNDASYFITMKTVMGEQIIWGKNLQQAVAQGNVQKNAEIVLSNTGKRDVTVTEKVFGADGKQTGTREKSAKLNQWTAQPLALYNQQARTAGATPAQGREQAAEARAAPDIQVRGHER
jgi:putative DNA primase/helicase